MSSSSNYIVCNTCGQRKHSHEFAPRPGSTNEKKGVFNTNCRTCLIKRVGGREGDGGDKKDDDDDDRDYEDKKGGKKAGKKDGAAKPAAAKGKSAVAGAA